ncbi:MAG: sugar phosphate nucleotidyltransferase, partial [Defluviitaleaceae bacterium]|nr:sugar phosphate nucleotidyltransferase [Defluviitaleaceae bacterium]
IDEASRFGIMNTDPDDKIYEFDEKPKEPKNNLASMGIYIFTWEKLKNCLTRSDKLHSDSDFGKHIIPMMLGEGACMYAYRFNGYWKDVGTIQSYWESNMELTHALPEFNLYDDFLKIYTNSNHQPPQYLGANSDVRQSLLSEGCQIYGTVINSVLGHEVVVEEGAVIRDSIVMDMCTIGAGSVLEHCIIDVNTRIGANVRIGEGENIPNADKPGVYNTGITVIGENSDIPDGLTVGKNCVICGQVSAEHFDNMRLESGGTVIAEEQEAVS